MKKLLLFVLISGTLAACTKGKFETIPQVEITSFGPPEVVKGQLIRLTANVTDKEGDVQDSVYVVKKRFNGTVPIGTIDTVRYSIESLGAPKKQQIEVQVLLLYGESRP